MLLTHVLRLRNETHVTPVIRLVSSHLDYLWVGEHFHRPSLKVGQQELPPSAPQVDTLVGGPAVGGEHNWVLLACKLVISFLIEDCRHVGWCEEGERVV